MFHNSKDSDPVLSEPAHCLQLPCQNSAKFMISCGLNVMWFWQSFCVLELETQNSVVKIQMD